MWRQWVARIYPRSARVIVVALVDVSVAGVLCVTLFLFLSCHLVLTIIYHPLTLNPPQTLLASFGWEGIFKILAGISVFATLLTSSLTPLGALPSSSV